MRSAWVPAFQVPSNCGTDLPPGIDDKYISMMKERQYDTFDIWEDDYDPEAHENDNSSFEYDDLYHEMAAEANEWVYLQGDGAGEDEDSMDDSDEGIAKHHINSIIFLY